MSVKSLKKTLPVEYSTEYRIAKDKMLMIEKVCRLWLKISGPLAFIMLMSFEAVGLEVTDAQPEGQAAESAPAHVGFFFRMDIRGGLALYSGSGRVHPTPGVRALWNPEHLGPMLGGQFSIGGSVIPGLAIHGDIGYERLLTTKQDPSSQAYGTFSAGLGVTHYFMPINIYITGSVRWMRNFLILDDAEVCYASDRIYPYDGIGLWTMFGKEWLVGENTGLGVGVGANYGFSFSDTPTFHYFSALGFLTLTVN
ncbi:MAG: hypothetical protein GY847_27335 [Proteobacteria bacterium]|nr:hypothetical protein [Pseudomonadota bacterium]